MAEIIAINENTWRIEEEGVRFFLLQGREKALLLDTGMSCPNARQLAESVTDKPLLLMNTHADPDHISGNAAFDSCLMHAEEEGNYRSFGGSNELVPLQDGDSLDLGGRPLKIISIPGHTPGSIALLDVSSRVLYSGDSVQNGLIFMFGPARNPQAYRESLAKLEAMRGDFDLVYPCHGAPEVRPELIPLLRQAVDAMLSDKAEGHPVNQFGMSAVKYDFDCASFLMEK